ncbi:hypothetical protein GRJ2_001725700 [Grus japonensis]|uniref:SGNH hydrolase-type esterase domain-containing protein n=1 Tax=Grus japonensis TaxID=30415 RepID=A0ABC9X4U5_GRUJA
MRRLEGRSTGEGPQPIAQRHAGHIAACSKPKGDEPAAPDATGTNRETLGEYIKRIEGSEWKQVHAWRSKRTFSSSTTSPSHVPLYNRYKALAVEGHSSEDMDDSQATPEVAPRPKRPMPQVMTTPTKKKGRVIVVGDSLLKVEGSNIGRNRWTQSINVWLHGWCQRHNFEFFDNGTAYTAPGLMNPDGIHLSQKGKRIFAQELAGLIDRALN